MVHIAGLDRAVASGAVRLEDCDVRGAGGIDYSRIERGSARTRREQVKLGDLLERFGQCLDARGKVPVVVTYQNFHVRVDASDGLTILKDQLAP